MNDITLKDKIFMENENIKIENEIEKKIKSYFKEYIGKKIIINDGTLLKKIREDNRFKEILNEKNYTVKPLNNDFVKLNLFVKSNSGLLLTVNIKLCFNGGNYIDKTYYCVYVEHSLYVGQIKNDILTSIEENEQIPLINFEYQEKQINLFKEKSKQLKEIRDNINYILRDFIKYDLVN